MQTEQRLRIGDREELIYMLAEAAAVEHNVMCCYLYGIWSLKRGERDGLTPEQAEAVARWKALMMRVAVEEMTHLTLVGNLTVAIGGAPHFTRPEFPIRAGYHPAAIDLELFGFSHALLDHAIFLERPEGVEMHDAPEFVPPAEYERSQPKGMIMPGAQDYATIGHLYRGIYHGFEVLNRRYGGAALFCGDVADQISPGDAPLPGLRTVTDLASAHDAIETIVEQGEGAPAHSDESHFNAFMQVRAELEALQAKDPGFAPAFPVARNPSLRKPLEGANQVWITDPEAMRVLDLGNSVYNLMLRFLVQAYGRAPGEEAQKRLFVQLARETMWLLSPIGEYAASLPAGPEHPGVNAGMTFTLLRDVARLPEGRGEMRMLAERAREIAVHTLRFFPEGHDLARTAKALEKIADKIAPEAPASAPAPVKAPTPDDVPQAATTAVAAASAVVEHAEARDLTLHFKGRRCIHARHCVLGAPTVFLANVKGDWLFPDTVESSHLRGVCHACPSGALSYTPKGDTPAEPKPAVNTARLRENGPYAFNATLEIAGQADGMRATLCRCGASKHKPYCDGSHKEIGFTATGEPDTRPSEPLAVRDGVLSVTPLHNGPLQVEGNLEIISGTGRTVDRITTARLCRCGGSSNKPFCDNTHLKIGFKSD